ncbi:Histone deacetylase complex subunit [Coemansia sp. RSA 2559]|nr:Histone deacetylase complex subunit [Coemansia sp. RSA 2559]KAJ2866161.1 Histone deacetylase complex subunit [Coemansia erecta]
MGSTKSTETGTANNDSGYAEDQQADGYSVKDEGGEDENNEDDESDEEDEDEEEDEGDDGVVRCVCGERNDGELMIQCEICQVWQHTLCMGIRDEAHIPDKYYCEKCRPEDHPYINSRPRTLVLAEASAIGTSTMMRRSAVMAVAKMSAHEEYRSAAAAAAIAASVAASSSINGGARRTPKKQSRKPESASSSATPRSAARGSNRSRRQSQRADDSRSTGGDDLGAENSDGDYTRGGNGNGYNDGDDGSNGNRTGHGRTQRREGGLRKNQTPKRSSASGNYSNGGKRRKVANQSPEMSSRSRNSNSANGLLLAYAEDSGEMDGNASSDMDNAGSGDDIDAQYAQEDVVARMMGAKINDATPRGNRSSKTRTPKSRNRSVSTIVKSNADDSSRSGGLAVVSPSRKSLKHEYPGSANGKRRGKSAPGSPRLDSQSPSPTLQSMLYGEADNDDTKADRSSKRRRAGGGSSRIGKHNRMAVSATNSPYLGNSSVFGSFDDGMERQGGRMASNSATAFGGDKGKGAGVDAYGTNESEGAYDYGKAGVAEYAADEDRQDDGGTSCHHSRQQPKHKFPPLETTDIDGNKVTIPSHLLNNQGQPMYSSADPETMCKIRYPHHKTSMFELNRRAKQLLEWLGKMQSEYEHEANNVIEPLDSNGSERSENTGNRLALSSAKKNMPIDRVASRQVSEAPTSPIDPADWPDEEGYDGEEEAGNGAKKNGTKDNGGAPKQQRPTLSIMEDLVWRLIRFQETYST